MFMLSLMQPSGLYELEKDSLEAISAQLLQMIRMKSYELYKHSLNVANYSVSIAAKLGLPANEIIQIKHGALLHDLGLITMSSATLKKAPFLTRQELSRYRMHPTNGVNMIENYSCCQPIIPYILHHHERWDGSGFPKHLVGSNIPLGARIIGIADYYDSAINPSTESWSKSKKTAKQELFSGSNILFDPDIVKAFIEIIG